jgi:hypothetical protein
MTDCWLPAVGQALRRPQVSAQLLLIAYHGVVVPSRGIAFATPVFSLFMLRFGA